MQMTQHYTRVVLMFTGLNKIACLSVELVVLC